MKEEESKRREEGESKRRRAREGEEKMKSSLLSPLLVFLAAIPLISFVREWRLRWSFESIAECFTGCKR